MYVIFTVAVQCLINIFVMYLFMLSKRIYPLKHALVLNKSQIIWAITFQLGA